MVVAFPICTGDRFRDVQGGWGAEPDEDTVWHTQLPGPRGLALSWVRRLQQGCGLLESWCHTVYMVSGSKMAAVSRNQYSITDCVTDVNM